MLGSYTNEVCGRSVGAKCDANEFKALEKDKALRADPAYSLVVLSMEVHSLCSRGSSQLDPDIKLCMNWYSLVR